MQGRGGRGGREGRVGGDNKGLKINYRGGLVIVEIKRVVYESLNFRMAKLYVCSK